MKAVDTNVIARALMRDDPVQTPLADAVLQDGAYVPLTVLLELGWLLRSRYGLSRHAVVLSLRSLIDMPGVVIEEPHGVAWMLGRIEAAGDLADLMHLVAARRTSSFVTFDTGVSAAAGDEPPVPVETLR